MARLLLYSVIALCFATVSSQNNKDPLNDFCRRFGHQSAVVDRKLYIDGGLVNWNPISQNPLNYSNPYLSYHDLDVTKDGMPQLHADLSKTGSIPIVSGGVLWADEVNKMIYLYGGDFQDSTKDFTLWAYDIILDQWDKPKDTASTIQRVSWGAGVTVNERGEGYYLGGWLSNQTVPDWVGEPKITSTLIKYDMVENTWTNNTGPNDDGRAEGVMVFIPASDSGLLISFGGILDPFKNGTVIGSPMNTIHIYDIASAKWYTQTVSGDIPDMRRRFCAGATWAADQSSYNIYLYGGAGIPPATTGFDDVYILTLPSFIWVKWWPTEPGPGKPHNSLTCNVINHSQMLIIGGTFPLTDECDAPSTWGVHNLNLGKNGPKQAAWDLYFPNITEYTVPSEVVAHIGGWATGGATMKSPQKWDNRDLPVYFSRIAQFSARTPTRSIPSATATESPPSSGTSRPHKDNHVAAIAGGVAGGGAGLILILALILYCLHRHKKSKKRRESAPAELDGKNVPRTPNAESRSEPSPGMQSAAPLWTTTQSHGPTNSGYPPAASPTVMIATSPESPVAYFSPISPYGPPTPQGQYFIPVAAHAQAAYPHHHPYPPPQFVQPSPPPMPQQQQAQAHPYNPAEHAFHQQHFPPPPPSGSQSAPTPASSSSYSDCIVTAPPSQTQTPANFYPQPLSVSRWADQGAPATRGQAQGRFVEEEDEE